MMVLLKIAALAVLWSGIHAADLVPSVQCPVAEDASADSDEPKKCTCDSVPDDESSDDTPDCKRPECACEEAQGETCCGHPENVAKFSETCSFAQMERTYEDIEAMALEACQIDMAGHNLQCIIPGVTSVKEDRAFFAPMVEDCKKDKVAFADSAKEMMKKWESLAEKEKEAKTECAEDKDCLSKKMEELNSQIPEDFAASVSELVKSMMPEESDEGEKDDDSAANAISTVVATLVAAAAGWWAL